MGEMGRAFDGSYAEYVLLPNEQIYPVHTDLDWTTLAAIPETYYTAFGSLQQLRIAPQDRVLVRGAGSGVGVAFAQLLKAQFPHIVLHGSTRNPAKAARLQAVGFDEVITEAGYSADQIDWLVPHQANKRIIESTAKHLGLNMDKVILTVAEHANTSAASIPLALDAGIRDGRIRRGQMLLLEGIGGGFAWGAVLMKY